MGRKVGRKDWEARTMVEGGGGGGDDDDCVAFRGDGIVVEGTVVGDLSRKDASVLTRWALPNVLCLPILTKLHTSSNPYQSLIMNQGERRRGG